MQLAFDLTPTLQGEQRPFCPNKAWFDVSGIARGVGFTTAGQVSSILNDELQPGQNEVDGDYAQRLYDALWMAHFKLFLYGKDCATFCIAFRRKARRQKTYLRSVCR